MIERLGILIAGGRGERFGGPKALAMFRGRSLMDRAREELAAVCDEIVVVVPEGAALPVEARERVADAIEQAGPLSALVAGLEARNFGLALALAVDLPLLDRGHLGRLFEAAPGLPKSVGGAGHGWLAIVPAPRLRPQPLAALYAAGAAPPLRRALDGGARALVAAVMALAPRLLDDDALLAMGIPPAVLQDADTGADLMRLEAQGS